tara:strand:+ start:353 stop:742 length:390 start_codon:yes stop_codon:yes gene_type:complete
MDEFDIKKGKGQKHHKDKRGTINSSNKWSRSVYWYGSQNKTRGLRRKADRSSHHRRRKIQKEEIQNTMNTGNEPDIRPSFTCLQKRKSDSINSGISQLCSNRGPRNGLKTQSKTGSKFVYRGWIRDLPY